MLNITIWRSKDARKSKTARRRGGGGEEIGQSSYIRNRRAKRGAKGFRGQPVVSWGGQSKKISGLNYYFFL